MIYALALLLSQRQPGCACDRCTLDLVRELGYLDGLMEDRRRELRRLLVAQHGRAALLGGVTASAVGSAGLSPTDLARVVDVAARLEGLGEPLLVDIGLLRAGQLAGALELPVDLTIN